LGKSMSRRYVRSISCCWGIDARSSKTLAIISRAWGGADVMAHSPCAVTSPHPDKNAISLSRLDHRSGPCSRNVQTAASIQKTVPRPPVGFVSLHAHLPGNRLRRAAGINPGFREIGGPVSIGC
jgi:hypothetical protein